ncbi:CWF19-like protein 2 [Hordeum vulgare subsp. vulgare]|uniref:CWF19-like protein 2 n=1 Tax=Hordeum vulgare subsp. vulgare TaxID=112509 RepID=UPI001D1A4657|nr:CWF19-like protein 2 [Hordeum vulgare subsp. vulgare]
MVHHRKQYSMMGMVDNKQNVKVKEGGGENMNAKEKKKQIKEGDKKKGEKKMTRYKEDKERMKGNDKKEKEKGRRRKRKENEKKMNTRKERGEGKENETEDQEWRENKKEIEEGQKEIYEQNGWKENDKKEEDSKERDANDQNDKKKCPQFFRTLITSSSMEQETIPEDCHKYLEECTGVVSLRGPSGNLWPVELAKISGELCFGRGWKEFLCDHRIGYGYLLVFRYDGQSQFSVTVFLPSSCEAPNVSLAQPQRMDAGVAAEDESGHTGTNADGTAPQEEDSHIGTGADGTPQNEEGEEEEDASEEYEGGDNMSVDADGSGPPDEQQDRSSEGPESEQDSEWCSAPSNQQKVDDIMSEVLRSKKSKAKEEKRHEALSGDSESEGEAFGDSLATESEHRPPRKSKAAEEKRPEAPSGGSLAESVRRPPKKSKAEEKKYNALASKGEASSDNLAELEHRPARKSKAAKRKRPEAESGHSETDGAESGDSIAELVRRPPKKSKAKGKRSAASSASKGTTSIDSLAGVFAPESICKDLTTLRKSCGNKYRMESQFPMFNKSNSENQPGRVLIKVQRRPELKSQRRPVTQSDKKDAMNRARRLESKRPYVMKEMNHTNVYGSCFMIIPDMFVENFLPKDSRKMTLWDPQAKPWKVSYEYTGGERPRAAFSTGWGVLAMENNLEKWDICILELLDQEDNIKLHVFRAVLEITPFVLAPKHSPQGCPYPFVVVLVISSMMEARVGEYFVELLSDHIAW